MKKGNGEGYSHPGSYLPLKVRLRAVARDAFIFALSLRPRGAGQREWIRFPYYHHVFDEERRGFERHLRFMKNAGDFIGLDDAVSLLRSGDSIGGRFFCVTFDDGFKNTLTNAAPVLSGMSCPAAVFLPTDYIGGAEDGGKGVKPFYATGAPVEFLDWDDCAALLRGGWTIGSHTCGHARLSDLAEDQVADELIMSKAEIERRTGAECRHFSCPFGTPGRDFSVERDTAVARRAGYESFFTTRRGSNAAGTDPFFVLRDHVVAAWGDYQLRYFFGLDN